MKTNKTILSISLVAILVVATLGISYSYFSANIKGSESVSTISMDAGKMELTYQNNSGDIVLDKKIYPRGTTSSNSASDAWVTKTFALNGTNTTDLEMKYKISMVVDNNTFENNALSYELIGHKEDSDTTSVVLDSVKGNIPKGSGTVEFNGTVTPLFQNANKSIHNYTLRIYFLDTGVEQNSNQEAKFAAHIVIAGVE